MAATWTVESGVGQGITGADGDFGLLLGSRRSRRVVAWICGLSGEPPAATLNAAAARVNPALAVVGAWGVGSAYDTAIDVLGHVHCHTWESPAFLGCRLNLQAADKLGSDLQATSLEWFDVTAGGTASEHADVSLLMPDAENSWGPSILLRMPIIFSVPTGGAGNIEQALTTQAKELKAELTSPRTRFVCLESGSVAAIGAIADDILCENFVSIAQPSGPPTGGGKSNKGKRKKGLSPAKDARNTNNRTDAPVTAHIEIMHAHSGFSSGHAPAQMSIAPSSESRSQDIQLWIDLQATPLADEPLKTVLANITSGCGIQIDEMLQQLVASTQSTAQQLSTPTAFHFKPLGYSTTVTVVYPLAPGETVMPKSSESETHLQDYRKAVHRRLGIAAERPLFRRVMSTAADGHTLDAACDRLCNPHATLKPSGVEGGTLHITEGRYLYYHYMQDKFDDNGWGCAYRSFQTITSWFVLQGYTQVEVPNHRQIQELCVKNGVRQKSFIGSKEWIGSMEVGWLLQWTLEELDVENKYMTSVLGSDLPSKGRELAKHFDEQGTPIMIGGNNLAHTIIGVDYNAATGDIKWLILDPHYTGGENLKIIQDKGWCAWKGCEFWKGSVTYNLCLPLRPKIV